MNLLDRLKNASANATYLTGDDVPLGGARCSSEART